MIGTNFSKDIHVSQKVCPLLTFRQQQNHNKIESTSDVLAQCYVTSADKGIGIHFDLTKLKSFIFSGEVNVDVASSHLVAVEGHVRGICVCGDDCTTEGERGADIRRKERETQLFNTKKQ